MSDQPTKAEVEDNAPKLHQIHLLKSHIDALKAENLAQGEDLAAECIRYGKLALLYRQQGEDMVEVLKQRDELKAENLAKCEELKGLRWEYNDLLRFVKLQGEISRDAIAAMDLRLLRLGEEMAQQLKAENLALKSSSYRADKQDGE